MPRFALNPAMIRVVLIVLFVLVSQILRFRKMSKAPKPPTSASKGSPMEALRESMRQASEQARARQGKTPAEGGVLQPIEQLQMPSKIEPESSFIPSMLLVALLACLCLMAYRYWAG
jgi:hypothetical protein